MVLSFFFIFENIILLVASLFWQEGLVDIREDYVEESPTEADSSTCRWLDYTVMLDFSVVYILLQQMNFIEVNKLQFFSLCKVNGIMLSVNILHFVFVIFVSNSQPETIEILSFLFSSYLLHVWANLVPIILSF